MRHRVAAAAAVPFLLLSLTSCSASYQDRTKWLDEMSAEGQRYREQLQAQKTDPTDAACAIGWDLLDDDPPYQSIPSDSETLAAQGKEAYIKSCKTGESIPKPDVSGIDSRSVVPHRSGAPTPTPSG